MKTLSGHEAKVTSLDVLGGRSFVLERNYTSMALILLPVLLLYVLFHYVIDVSVSLHSYTILKL